MAYLNEDEMRATRSPDDLSQWVADTCELLGQSKESRAYSRSGERLPKKFWEEIRPFSIYASDRFCGRADVICTPNLGNENYDGIIGFNDKSELPIYVEATYAKDGYDESIRLAELTKNGSVNALGRIATTGTKASGRRQVHIENEMVNHDETVNRALRQIGSRLEKKSTIAYGDSHVLLVVVDDCLPIRRPEDTDLMERWAKNEAKRLQLAFREVVLVGESGTYVATIRGKI